jgi:hypothetical protein
VAAPGANKMIDSCLDFVKALYQLDRLPYMSFGSFNCPVA